MHLILRRILMWHQSLLSQAALSIGRLSCPCIDIIELTWAGPLWKAIHLHYWRHNSPETARKNNLVKPRLRRKSLAVEFLNAWNTDKKVSIEGEKGLQWNLTTLAFFSSKFYKKFTTHRRRHRHRHHPAYLISLFQDCMIIRPPSPAWLSIHRLLATYRVYL